MKLSIVIPCYNARDNILVLLSSLEKQIKDDYYKLVEVIIVNDGSTDDTKDVISSFIENHDSFKLIDQNNSGAAIARTVGLDASTGEFIFFCDSDDEISPDFVSSFFDIKCDFDIFYFSSEIVYNNNGDKNILPKIKFNEVNSYSDPDEFLYKLLSRGQWTAAVWTYIFRRELAYFRGAVFTDRKSHEDHLFSLNLLFSANVILVSPDVLYRQIVTLGSLTNSKKDFSYIRERYEAYKEADEFISRLVSTKTRCKYYSWSIVSIASIIESGTLTNNRFLYKAILKIYFSMINLKMTSMVIFYKTLKFLRVSRF